MFCPNCKSEYREGFTRCSDCDVDLVADLSHRRGEEDPAKEDSVNVFESDDPALRGVVAAFLSANSIGYNVINAQFWVAPEDEDAAREIIRGATASEDEIAAGFAEATTGLHVRVWHYFRETGGSKTEEIEEPTWEKVEDEIRTMDPYEKPAVYITSGTATETDAFAITGGAGVYNLRFSDGDADWHEAMNPDRGGAELGVWTSVPGFTTTERFTWDIADALRIAKYFWERQQPAPDVEWN